MTVNNFTFSLQVLGLWDSHPKGRCGHIILQAPHRVQPLLLSHFEFLNARQVMLAETHYLKGRLPGEHSDQGVLQPAVLLSKYMGNNYVAFLHPPQDEATLAQMVAFVQTFLDVLYAVPMKCQWSTDPQLVRLLPWEADGLVVDRCECRLVSSARLALLIKGIFSAPQGQQPCSVFHDSLPLCQNLVAGDSYMLYCCFGCIRRKGGASSGLRADRERHINVSAELHGADEVKVVRSEFVCKVHLHDYIPLATRPDGGPVWSCGENYHFLAKDWVKGF